MAGAGLGHTHESGAVAEVIDALVTVFRCDRIAVVAVVVKVGTGLGHECSWRGATS